MVSRRLHKSPAVRLLAGQLQDMCHCLIFVPALYSGACCEWLSATPKSQIAKKNTPDPGQWHTHLPCRGAALSGVPCVTFFCLSKWLAIGSGKSNLISAEPAGPVVTGAVLASWWSLKGCCPVNAQPDAKQKLDSDPSIIPWIAATWWL